MGIEAGFRLKVAGYGVQVTSSGGRLQVSGSAYISNRITVGRS